MESWQALPASKLNPASTVTAAFLDRGAFAYREAARLVSEIPYGRNSNRLDTLGVLRERRGTCSTKHALLRTLAIEQKLPVALRLGVYEMSEANTPGVGRILSNHGLVRIPEAHCYLAYRGTRIDVTRSLDTPAQEAIGNFLHEEDIAPEQIGDYKIALHQRMLARWREENSQIRSRFSLADLWRIREACITALNAEQKA